MGFELINGKVKESASQTITDEFDKQIPTITEEEFNEGMQEQEQKYYTISKSTKWRKKEVADKLENILGTETTINLITQQV